MQHFPLIAALPFACLLLAIALGPVVAHEWWGRHRNQAIVAGLVSLPIVLYLGWGTAPPGATCSRSASRSTSRSSS